MDETGSAVRPSSLRCVKCDYDLTGTMVGEQCLECGARVQESIDALRPAGDRSLSHNQRAGIAMTFFSGGLGAAIWGFSPAITGQIEPWDANSLYYIIALLTAGFVSALMFPRYFWFAPIGIYVGQFTYALAMVPTGPLWVIGVAIGAAYCLLAAIGAALGFGLAKLTSWPGYTLGMDKHGGDISPSTLRCVKCDYDLTGTTVGGNCPECGARVQESIDALTKKDRELPRSELATAALFVGLASFCLFPLGPIALVLGIIARRQLHRGDYRPSARISADIGMLIGGLTSLIGLLYLTGLVLGWLR